MIFAEKRLERSGCQELVFILLYQIDSCRKSKAASVKMEVVSHVMIYLTSYDEMTFNEATLCRIMTVYADHCDTVYSAHYGLDYTVVIGKKQIILKRYISILHGIFTVVHR